LIIVEICEIRGKCPVHKVGDKIVIDGPRILVNKTDALCIHALSTIVHYALALEHGADPIKLGLTTPEDPENAYIQCVDPWKPYTDGGTVIFKMRKIK